MYVHFLPEERYAEGGICSSPGVTLKQHKTEVAGKKWEGGGRGEEGEKEREYKGPKLQFKPTVPESGWGGIRQDYLAIVPKSS